jgi:homoserine O-acetyltransferase
VNSHAADNSVGLVKPAIFRSSAPFTLQCGVTLPGFELVYETYGQLNPARSNAILICHALSGHHHAAGYHTPEDDKPGWWDSCIGPGKPIDTRRFFVVSLNNLGGCNGSTGPLSLNPSTGAFWGPDFPTVTVRDWVESQTLLANALGIRQFAAVIGGSLGGMQAMLWAMEHPERVRAAVLIATAARLSAQNIAFNEIARQAILSDPEFYGGRYREADSHPERGLSIARMVGHVTYLSGDGMHERFGRALKSGDRTGNNQVQFQVESYLQYQGRSFSRRFDANTYLLMTRALDLFDPAADAGDDLARAFAAAEARFLVIAFSSDWRFSAARSKEIVDALVAARKNVASAVIESPHGHDSFLLELPRYFDVLRTWLSRLADEVGTGTRALDAASG